MTEAVYQQQGVRLLRDDLCERSIIELVNRYRHFCKGIGIGGPIWIFTALLGFEGVRVNVLGFAGNPIQRTLVFLPEFKVDSLDIDPTSYLRPLFDCLANPVWLERSLNYDEQGNRRERRDW